MGKHLTFSVSDLVYICRSDLLGYRVWLSDSFDLVPGNLITFLVHLEFTLAVLMVAVVLRML